MPRPRSSQSFTLVELLAVVAILAVLIAGAIYYTASYIQWAKQTTEKEIYTVLNDELTRYKSGGGNIAALTVGAPIGDVFSALQTPVTPAGMPASLAQQFMPNNYTYPGRSLFATGTGQQYHFYQVDQYVGQNIVTGTPTSTYPHGSGNGYLTTNSSGIDIAVFTSTGYWAVQTNASGSPQIFSSGWSGAIAGTSATFWACQDATHSTPSGSITSIDCDNLDDYGAPYYVNAVSIDVSGLPSLTSLNCHHNSFTSIALGTATRATINVDISTNPICNGSPVNAFYSSLPTVTNGSIITLDDDCLDNSGTISIANAKGWTVNDNCH
jgi:prepilin-type N-terminal cleavage/methylation domain-containing protein